MSYIRTLFRSAGKDIAFCIERPNCWYRLALNDVYMKYRRTKLGPIWVVMGIGLTISMMSFLWSAIFGLDWRSYLPYIIAGFVTWLWISQSITQACEAFATEYNGFIKALSAPLISYVLRFSFRQLFLFLHYILLIFLSMLITLQTPNVSALFWFPVGLFLIFLNTCFVTIFFGFLCARVRDFSALIASVIGPMMLLTPVIWRPEMLGSWIFLAWLNPITHFIEIIRAPLIGDTLNMTSVYVVILITLLNGFVSLLIYERFKNRLVFWL